MSSLLIISHTPHFQNSNSQFVGLESTVREINHLEQLFDTIYHIAPLYRGDPIEANLAYKPGKIFFKPIIPTGGNSLFKKMGILLIMPINLYRICKMITKVDCIHFRAPTNFGIFVLPLLSLVFNKKKWVKYAGSWHKKTVPLSYKLQRLWLKNNFQNSMVTINGIPEDKKNHLISFKNPCLTKKEIKINEERSRLKSFNDKLTFCFVGRLEENKGFTSLIEALPELEKLGFIEKIHFAGEFYNKKNKEKLFLSNNMSIIFHGMIKREKLDKIYSESHFLILPSKSEGFPKVIAEASSFGCIPIIAPIKSIIFYINEKKQNGFELKDTNPKEIVETVKKIKKTKDELPFYSKNAIKFSREFSYEIYNKRIRNEILSI